jgi:hypothetical protein
MNVEILAAWRGPGGVNDMPPGPSLAMRVATWMESERGRCHASVEEAADAARALVAGTPEITRWMLDAACVAAGSSAGLSLFSVWGLVLGTSVSWALHSAEWRVMEMQRTLAQHVNRILERAMGVEPPGPPGAGAGWVTRARGFSPALFFGPGWEVTAQDRARQETIALARDEHMVYVDGSPWLFNTDAWPRPSTTQRASEEMRRALVESREREARTYNASLLLEGLMRMEGEAGRAEQSARMERISNLNDYGAPIMPRGSEQHWRNRRERATQARQQLERELRERNERAAAELGYGYDPATPDVPLEPAPVSIDLTPFTPSPGLSELLRDLGVQGGAAATSVGDLGRAAAAQGQRVRAELNPAGIPPGGAARSTRARRANRAGEFSGQNPENPSHIRAAGPNIGASERTPTTPTAMPSQDPGTRFLPRLPRRFGVELEAKGMNPTEAAGVLAAAGFRVQDLAHLHDATRGNVQHWRVVYDGSVNGGFEAVSPPLNETLEVWKACNALRARGGRVDRQCGTHVHVEAGDYELADFKALAKLWMRFEGAIDALMQPNRRGDLNQYTKSNLRAMIRRTGAADGEGAMAGIFQRIDACETSMVIRDTLQGLERYYKLNLHAFWKHRTIEFRGHGGTLNGTKLTYWIALVVGLVVAAKRRPQIPASVGTMTELLALVAEAIPEAFQGAPLAAPGRAAATTSTGPTPRADSETARLWAAFDALWIEAGRPAEVASGSDLRRAMGAAARGSRATAGATRVAFYRWRAARLGHGIPSIPVPLASAELAPVNLRARFVAFFEARVLELAGGA